MPASSDLPPLRLDTSLEQLLDRMGSVEGPAALATIVSTAGSTYRKAGARMLIEASGRLTGLLSGGCFEHDLHQHARRILDANMAERVSYDTRGDEDLVFGLGAGCEGAMQILLEPANPDSPATRALRAAAAALNRNESTVLCVVHAGLSESLGTRLISAENPPSEALASAYRAALMSGQAQTASWVEHTRNAEAWIQYLAPVPRVLLCGAGYDAEPVAAWLQRLCWHVVVVDHRPAYANASRFPGCEVRLMAPDELSDVLSSEPFFAAIVMSHHLVTDAACLTALAGSPVPHIELLGPLARRDRLLTLTEKEVARRVLPRLRSPAGLNLGASTPESIALCIVAELHALASGRNAVSLRSTSDR